jgi:uncharacterized protein (DUF1800 family)
MDVRMPSEPAHALVALHRFGLGARPGDPGLLQGDPKGYVHAQLGNRASALLTGDGLLPGEEAFRRHRAYELRREEARVVVADSRQPTRPSQAIAMMVAPTQMPNDEPSVTEQVFKAEITARYARLASSPDGLIERLVAFWSNHFAVSISKAGSVRVLAGAFEREAIRPHLLGRFADMLVAVETHPAMLFNLDNAQSVGPRSRNGRNGRKGLNENLAREVMELHTLGVDGGYTQADVTSLARIITGWTVSSPDEDSLYGGRFTFAPARHEPGAQTVMGAAYEQAGYDQGRAALEALAVHPATARHLARKLASHFIADQPPQAVVDRLTARYLDSGGDLAVVTAALVEAEEAWTVPLGKVRQPWEFVVAALRATGMPADFRAVNGALAALGQPIWDPPGPNGWPDTTQAWVSPKGLEARLDLAADWGRRNASLDPVALVPALFGSDASAETRQAIARAESRQQGLAILFMSPEFQRR